MGNLGDNVRYRKERGYKWGSWRKVQDTGKKMCSCGEVGGRCKIQGRESLAGGKLEQSVRHREEEVY